MPIGDILASITGEKPSSSAPPTVKPTLPTGVKRKVTSSSDSNGAPSKIMKQSHSASQTPNQRRPSPSSSRPTTLARPSPSATNGQHPVIAAASSTSNGKTYSGTAAAAAAAGRLGGKSVGTTASSLRKDISDSSRHKLNSTTLSAPSRPLTVPSPTTPTNSGPPKALKRGSMAEIMARAAKAQQIAPKAGLIQHKPVSETVMSRKEREERKRKPGSHSAKRTGENGTVPGNSHRSGDKPSASRLAQAKAGGTSRPHSSGSDMPEKKFPKAAAATTGYRGTARPPPGKSSDSRNGYGPSSRGRSLGGMLDPPGYSRRGRDDEEDPDLDDFIDYDDDEEPIRSYDYDSEGSSDMEAGMDDIYREETRAEREAREEDRREEEMLARLKKEKEERKKHIRS